MSSLKKDSFDYMVLEKTKDLKIISYDGQWSDLGTWDKVEDVLAKNGLLSINKASSYLNQDTNCFVFSSNHKKVVLSGVEDLLIVNTEVSLFIIPKDDISKIKELVLKLKDKYGKDF